MHNPRPILAVRWKVFLALVGVPVLVPAVVPESLRPQPIAVRVVVPLKAGACTGGTAPEDLSAALGRAADSTGILRSGAEASALLRLKLDEADGLCDVGLDFQDESGQVPAHALLPAGQTVVASGILSRLVSQLARDIASRRFASIELASTPAGARVRLAGQEAGTTPLRLEGVAPGRIPVELSLPGWQGATDTVSLAVGPNPAYSRTLVRSASWRDSVSGSRRDSLWNGAKARPARDLAELFDRLAAPVPPGGRMAVAILPFDVQGKTAEGYDPGVMAAEYGVSRWSGDARFALVERQAVGRLLKEQAFAMSGAVSDSGAAEMGRLAAARYLVTGTVQVAGDKQVFSARLVSVETGNIVSAAVSEGGTAQLEDLYRDALGERGQLSASVYRSLVGPGWGQFYTGHPVHGSVALGTVLASLGFAAWAWVDYAGKDDDLQRFRKHDPATLREGESGDGWLARAEGARSDRNDAATMVGVSLGVVGAVWAANVIDAAVLGHLESRRIRARYFARFPVPVARPDGLALAWSF